MDNLNASEIEAGFILFNELKSSLNIEDRENPDKINEISFIAAAHAHKMARERYNAERNTQGI